MKMKSELFVYIALCFLLKIFANEDECPAKCECKRSAQKGGPNYIKLKCGETVKILDLDELELLNVASEIGQLNLSNNLLKTFSPKVELIALQKLDLSKNQITELQNEQFLSVPNLRRLDISGNNIRHINLHAFENLKHLERLKLNHNQINSVIMGTFDPLTNLKQLDISNNPLVCDCGLLWLLDWTQKNSVKPMSNPKCNSPSSFKGQLLRKVKIGVDIHCKSPAGSSGLPIIELKPSENQVVFEGDSLRLHCKAPSISDTYDTPNSSRLEWTWLDSNPKHNFSNVKIENQYLQSTGVIGSTLSITKLERNHTGIWSCLFYSLLGNHSKGITIVVISDDTRYCPMTVTTNNKGMYNWPRTIVNYTVTIPCESLNLNYDVSYQKASYFCSKDGNWENLNTSMCSYISDTTKILEQFSKVNSCIPESAIYFKNYTQKLVIFRDVVDFNFAVHTIQNYIQFCPMEHLGGILMDVTNNLLNLPKRYISEANLIGGSCSKLLNATEALAPVTNSSLLHKSNIALDNFLVRKDAFNGLKCTWYVNPDNRLDAMFYCVTNNIADTSGLQGKKTEASITIPETLFHQLELEQDYILTQKAYNIMISMHASGKLFPIDEARRGEEDITSAVVGAKLVDLVVRNLSDPIFVMLRTPTTTAYEVTPFIPVWWDPSLNNGTGSWSSDGCEFSHEFDDHMVFSCNQFGYFGLLQDITHLQNTQTGAKFKLSHPAIYIGSFILFVSLLIATMTYLLCYPAIQMPKKAKHSLINMWIAINMLCFMYVFGIYQTEDVKVCQLVGMILHYFTLSSLLWMCVGINCMHKRLSKNDIIDMQDDDLPSDQPIQKPILGLYLVGWGVALIICGISAAINIKEYSSPSHCFLRTGPALSALYIPFLILMIFLCVYFLLIRCAIYNLDANGHLSEGTQATEHVDLDLLEPNFPNMDSRSVRSMSTKTASSEVEDPEHAPAAQLKAYIIFLLVYIVTWLSCAFATVPPLHVAAFEEDLFSVAYAIFATTLSAFTLFFYCIARNDVRSQWVLLTRGMRKKRVCFRTRNVSDTTPTVPQIQVQPLPLPPVSNILTDGLQVNSRSGSRTSSHTKSNSHTSNILKGAADLNGSFSDHPGTKINNVNLIVLHRAQYRTNVIPNIIENPTDAAEVFYNPHQSTVARKFFKRQKRHMVKKNNLAPRPRDLNSDTASVFSEPRPLKEKSNLNQNMFGTNSKVNNTNIHVEHVRRSQQKNPNIFSDSADDFDTRNNVPVDKIVINAERLRRKELSKHKTRKKHNNHHKSLMEEDNMRSVSQQCTLEYSSENISDSILDKGSPEKTLLANHESFLTEVSEPVPSIRRENSPIESILTEDDPNYCKINDVHSDSTINNDFFQEHSNTCRRKKQIANENYEPSEMSFSVMDSSVSGINGSAPRIYINPHDVHLSKSVQSSRPSSASVSDLDELYQQIRRGPKMRHPHSNIYVNSSSLIGPCLSDSEVNSYVSDIRHQNRIICSTENFDNLSDSVETTV